MGWLVLFVSTWAALYFSTDLKRFKAFWTGGLWSVGLAVLGEALIRAPLDFFVPDRLLLPFLGAEFINFLGPRFVEGILFMQSLRPTRQLFNVFGWVGVIVLSEVALALRGYVNLSASGIGLSLAVHTLRFLSLLGIYHALDYTLLTQRLRYESARRTLGALLLDASRRFWPFSWPFFALSTASLLKMAGVLDRWFAKNRS